MFENPSVIKIPRLILLITPSYFQTNIKIIQKNHINRFKWKKACKLLSFIVKKRHFTWILLPNKYSVILHKHQGPFNRYNWCKSRGNAQPHTRGNQPHRRNINTHFLIKFILWLNSIKLISIKHWKYT